MVKLCLDKYTETLFREIKWLDPEKYDLYPNRQVEIIIKYE